MAELTNEKNENNTEYKVKLEQFEGPLDLLLHLIRDAKIDIKDIFISQITEEYLKYISEYQDMPMESVGEFVAMAATLLEIKSRKLLPKIEEIEEDEESPEQKLIRQLEEYKLFKEASEQLKEIDDADKFYKEPEPTVGDYRYILKDISYSGFIEAFVSLMHRVTLRSEAPSVKKIEKDRFTVAQKIAEIKDILLVEEEVMFSELFSDDYSKSEIINTFLALLELLKMQQIKARQEKLFDDICITKNPDKPDMDATSAKDIDLDYAATPEQYDREEEQEEQEEQKEGAQTDHSEGQTNPKDQSKEIAKTDDKKTKE